MIVHTLTNPPNCSFKSSGAFSNFFEVVPKFFFNVFTSPSKLSTLNLKRKRENNK